MSGGQRGELLLWVATGDRSTRLAFRRALGLRDGASWRDVVTACRADGRTSDEIAVAMAAAREMIEREVA